MKTLNFWRTLFLSMLAVTAFVACTDNDEEEFTGIPEITVNGASDVSVAHDLSEGYTEAVKVVSSGPWTLALENESDKTWCTPSAYSGNGGESELKFYLAAATEARQTKVLLTTNGELMGYPIPRTATITIMQNAGGSTAITTNVKAIRAQLTFEQEAATISESIVVTGICVSDVEGNNINNKSIMLADNTTEPGAGLFIRFNDVNGKIKMGNIVSVELNGGKSQSYYGTCQVNGVSLDAAEVLDANDNTPAPIAVTDPSKLIEYQSQYVSVYSQPVESVRGQAYYNVSSGYANINFETPNGGAFQLSFNSYSSSWAKNVTIPANSGNIKGCVSINNNAGNVSPRNADDLADMTQELFTVESTSATIDKITGEGSYKVENVTVVATNLQGFVIADNTGAFYVTRGKDGVVPELGKVITIEGTVGSYGGMLQFDKDAAVTETGSVEVTYPDATVVAADNLQSIVDAKKVVYVKSTGTLIKSSNYYNWNFDFTPTGTANIGAILYPDVTKLGLEEMVNQNVEIEGYFVYTTGKGERFSVVVTSIKKGEGGETPEPTPAVTIDQITAEGSYKVEGVTVVATNLQGFVIADNTGAFYVNRGKGGVVPELGKVITIEGTVGSYGGMLQFDKDAAVTETGSVEVTYPDATVVAADNLQSIVDAKKVVYIKSTGTLINPSGYYNWNFDFTPTGTANIGAILYPDVTKLGLAEMVDQKVEIEGYFVYTTGEGARFSVVVTSIKKGEGGETPAPTEPIETTIAELVAKIEPQTEAAVLDASNDYVFEGVVVNDITGKNYARNNLYLATEGATTAKNGLMLYGSAVDATTLGLAWGTRVKVTLKAGLAKIQNRYDVFQITGSGEWCTVESLGSTATIEPVTITADKIADYQGMYVSIEGTTTAAGVWGDSSSNKTTTLTTANGDLKVFVNKIAGDTFNLPYAATTGVVKGIAMVYGSSNGSTPELLPQTASDVAAFTPADPTITGVDPVKLTWAAAETDAKTINVTGVELAGNLTAALSGANADKWGEPTVATDGTTVTIAPVAANESDADYTATLTLTVGATSKTVALTQSKPASQGGGEAKWVKVTSAPADWSGDYLIVYEDGNLIFDGSLMTLDAIKNTKPVTIANGEIASSTEVDACKFTVVSIEGGYSIKSASGYYIYQSSDANGLKSNTSTTGLNTLSLNEDGSAQITSSKAVLRYNATSNQTRFRYYKSSSYTGQKPIALYKYTK